MFLTKFQLLFLCTIFIVSFASDLILNDLTRQPLIKYHNNVIIKSLGSYFKDKGLVESGIYAGLTIVIAYILLMIGLKLMGLGSIPSRELVYCKLTTPSIKKLLLEILFAFILGYAIDILIDKYRIFGDSLNAYYTIAGSGFWGAVAFLFAILLSYLLLLILGKLFI